MVSTLSVSLIQFDIYWESPDENLKQLSQLISTLNQTDVIVLPEMFSTGFSMNPQRFGTDHQEKVITWMQKVAQEKNCAICGSFIFKEKENYFNRFVWVDETNQMIHYNKTHLFSLAGEEKVYQRDINSAPIIQYKGWKLLPQICYDLRFPESSRNQLNYDILLYVANWPEKRSSAWNALLKARAIENVAYVVGCNRVGFDNNKIYHVGDSQILSFDGTFLQKSGKDTTQILQDTLHKNHLISFREKFSFLSDQFL